MAGMIVGDRVWMWRQHRVFSVIAVNLPWLMKLWGGAWGGESMKVELPLEALS